MRYENAVALHSLEFAVQNAMRYRLSATLFSTTWIPSIPDTGCDARQTHRPSPLWPCGKPSVATIWTLAYSQVYASINPDCSCTGGATWKLSQLVDVGFLFSAVARERHPDACTPLHHSICLPLTGFESRFYCASVHMSSSLVIFLTFFINRWRLEPKERLVGRDGVGRIHWKQVCC